MLQVSLIIYSKETQNGGLIRFPRTFKDHAQRSSDNHIHTRGRFRNVVLMKVPTEAGIHPILLEEFHCLLSVLFGHGKNLGLG